MPEPGYRTPADNWTALSNLQRLQRQGDIPRRGFGQAAETTDALREELRDKGLPGFKRGGRVHRTGLYKVHAGERIVSRGRRRGRR